MRQKAQQFLAISPKYAEPDLRGSLGVFGVQVSGTKKAGGLWSTTRRIRDGDGG